MRYLTTSVIALDLSATCAPVTAHGTDGALVTFFGIVRADGTEPRRVHALYYEAHETMAEREIDRIAAEARERWLVTAIWIRHRLGLVECGQVSVAVVVAAPHRAKAYAASQFLITRIKAQVPIWKRAHYEDGTSAWSSTLHRDESAAPEETVSHAHV